MSKIEVLRSLVAERLTAAVEEIFSAVEKMMTEKKKRRLHTAGQWTQHSLLTQHSLFKSLNSEGKSIFLMSVFLFTNFQFSQKVVQTSHFLLLLLKIKTAWHHVLTPAVYILIKIVHLLKRQNASVLETEINTITPFWFIFLILNSRKN